MTPTAASTTPGDGARFVVHPTDFSPASELAFAHALRLAVTSKGRLTLLHVGDGADGLLDALRGTTTEQVIRRAPCPVLAVPADE